MLKDLGVKAQISYGMFAGMVSMTQFFLWVLLMLAQVNEFESSTITLLAGAVVCIKVLEIFYNPAGMLLQVRDAMVILTEIDHEVKKPPRGMKDSEKYHLAMKQIKGKLLHVNHQHVGRLHPSLA